MNIFNLLKGDGIRSRNIGSAHQSLLAQSLDTHSFHCHVRRVETHDSRIDRPPPITHSLNGDDRRRRVETDFYEKRTSRLQKEWRSGRL
jgi:hypothetical protein